MEQPSQQLITQLILKELEHLSHYPLPGEEMVQAVQVITDLVDQVELLAAMVVLHMELVTKPDLMVVQSSIPVAT